MNERNKRPRDGRVIIFDTTLRDGEQALINATQVMESSKKYNLPIMTESLGLVAGAYEALGDYKSATEWAEKAVTPGPRKGASGHGQFGTHDHTRSNPSPGDARGTTTIG